MNSKNSSIKLFVTEKFPLFGVNKIREISRLFFEISKRDNIAYETIYGLLESNRYEDIKKQLLNLRYPNAVKTVQKNNFYLPDVDIDDKNKVDFTNIKFAPKNIFYTKDVLNSQLFDRIKNIYKNANFSEIESLKSYLKENKFSIQKYNNRRKNLFLVNEKFDFFKKCPCTKNVVCCNYSLINIGFGCPYDCAYCFLQGYQNVAGIILPANIEDFLTDDKIVPIKNNLFDNARVGSGEWTDSLVFDDITLFSNNIVNFFRQTPDIDFEFKTKSINIENLLKLGGTRNIVVAWSVNAEQMIKENEYLTPDLQARLNAAQKCVQAGFSTAFHFDPVILYEGCKQGYQNAVDTIFDFIDEKYIKWISIGSFRMPVELKKTIENRFPENKILNGELLLDGTKLRYIEQQRINIYKTIVERIKKYSSKVKIYLCMENSSVWNKVF